MSDSQTTTASIAEMIQAGGAKDNAGGFERCAGILQDILAKVKVRFALTPHPNSEKYRTVRSLDGKFHGAINTYSGPGVDWLLHSWCGNPETGFTNQHLNVWLGPETRVPHLGIVFGTVPDLFAYQDFAPRMDLWSHPEYAVQYYGGSSVVRDETEQAYVTVPPEAQDEANRRILALLREPRFRRFVSQDAYMRSCVTPLTLCVSTDGVPEDLIATLEEQAHFMVDRWLGWLDDATPVPEEERAALAERDRRMRHEITSRDAANDVAQAMFGREMNWDMVRTTSGLNRADFE
jgi:hypothetical protein